MKMTDESALAVLDNILCDTPHMKPPSENAVREARDYLRARLAADQQKGSGEDSPFVICCDDCGTEVKAYCPKCEPSSTAPAQQDGKASGGENVLIGYVSRQELNRALRFDDVPVLGRKNGDITIPVFAHPPHADHKEPQG